MKKLLYVIIGVAVVICGCHSKGDSSVIYEDSEMKVTKIYYDESDNYFIKTNLKHPNDISWSQQEGKFRRTVGNVIVVDADTLLAKGQILLNDENFLVISKK